MAASLQYGLRFFAALIKILLVLWLPYFWLVTWLKPPKRIPSIKDKFLLISATELAVQIRNGKIKCENVVRAYIKRIQEVNPIVNAIVEDNFKAAIEDARAVDALIARKEKRPEVLAKEKPLLGVPITVKESCSVNGLSLTGGLLLRKGIKAEKDGEAVALLREAGAIILAITNTPELCMSGETNNLVYGRTSNPYDTNRSPAASSGGEGAIITSCGSVAGIGSDLAGSVRIPAMFTGLFGHKPTPYATPFEGHFPYSTDKDFLNLAVIGPMTRYAQDMKLMMKVLGKKKENILKLDEEVDVRKLNVFYKEKASNSLVITPVSRDIKKVMHKVVNYMEKLGANVKPAKFIDLRCKQEICCTHLAALKDLGKILEDTDKSLKSKNLYVETLKALFGYSNMTFETALVFLLLKMNFLIPPSKVSEYKEEAQQLRNVMMDVLGTNGVFLYPTFPIPAFQHYQCRFYSEGLFYSLIVNIWGFPATHVPLGLNKNGLPIGIQVVAGPNQDRLCLAVAEELEKKFGGWVPPTEILAD